VRVATVLDIGRSHGVKLPADTLEELRPFCEVEGVTPSLVAFLQKFEVLKQVFIDEDAIARIAEENVEDAAREGIDYVELRCSPAFMGEQYGLDARRVLAAVCRGVRAGTARLPVRAQVIGIMSRHLGEAVCWQELEAAIALQSEGVVAIDLAGDEGNFPGTRFVRHFQRAREAGLRITVHAGEAAGPESVRQAIEELGAERIGHGVHAIEDETVLQLIAERGVAIESCPTSNVQTSTVASYKHHPLPLFLHRGLLVTLGSDDPSISAIDLPHEYRVAHDELGLTEEELRTIQLNGVRAAFLSDREKETLLAKKRVV
jgi:adenosine deaminase